MTTPVGTAAILIVDDNDAKRLAIEVTVAPLGHPIVQAASGEAALRAVLAQTFAVILMDVQMPGMDGYETARLIRTRPASEHTPIIFITAHSRDEAQVAVAYASGAVDFIFAPLVPEILRAKVSVFVDLFLKSRALEVSLQDVTSLSDEFRDSEARSRSVLENVADGIVTIGAEGLIETFNRAASGLFGYADSEAIGEPFSDLIASSHPGDFATPAEADRDLLADKPRHGWPAESVGTRRDGTTFPIELDLRAVQLGARKVHIACVRDISERQKQTAALRHQALHDDLTGLPNRVLFGDRVDHAIHAALREKQPLALLVMDLDEFKHVNDTLGHQHGDLLLQQVAERLDGGLRDGDTLARLGGDEFGILPLGPTDLAGAASIAWKVQQMLHAPFVVKGHTIDVRASIGITLVPDHGHGIDDLLRRADLAMYDAKRTGSGYAVFAAEQEEAPARRLALLRDLRHCIERQELVLHYQPKIDLATRATVGVEALLRWNHPSGRLMQPADFIPEVENNELMVSITAWVVEEAVRRLRGWRDEGYDLTMAINLGARSLGANLFEMVRSLTETLDIPPERLIFELTESALIDTAAPELLSGLENMDTRLSIDDFGTGYSSLVYLQRLPFAEIKADRSFVMSMTTVPGDDVLVRSIIDLAHNLGVNVVAEGVEDEATMSRLIDYGCDEAQGYHFSRPMPGDDVARWLQTSPFGMRRQVPATAG